MRVKQSPNTLVGARDANHANKQEMLQAATLLSFFMLHTTRAATRCLSVLVFACVALPLLGHLQARIEQSSTTCLRWGVLGTGDWAQFFARTLRHTPGHVLQAVGSRHKHTADVFCETFNVPTKSCHASYTSLVHDPEVDVVYVVTPEAFHFNHSLLALQAGKHVLCEKAFTVNAHQAAELITIARTRKLFLMEAMGERFAPPLERVHQWLGMIGPVRSIVADRFVAMKRVTRCYNQANTKVLTIDPTEPGCSCLLTEAIYPITYVLSILGYSPNQVSSTVDFFEDSGNDAGENISLVYNSGAEALVRCSLRRDDGSGMTVFYGERGTIFYQEWNVRVTTHDGQSESFRYSGTLCSSCANEEVLEVGRSLAQGLLESPRMPLDETLAKMRVLDAIRARWDPRLSQRWNPGR